MSSMKKNPPKVLQVICMLLAFCLALSLFGGVMLGLVDRVLTDADMHHAIAANPELHQMQLEYITSAIHTQADKYGFDRDAVLAMVSGDQLDAYSRSITAWWMGLYGEKPVLNAPAFEMDGLEELLLNDEGLADKVAAKKLKKTVKDKIVPAIQGSVTKAVLPIQNKVLSMGLSKVINKIDLPKVVGLLHQYWPMVFAVSGALALLILLLMLGRVRALWLIGSGVFASGLLCGSVCAGVVWLDVAGTVAAASPRLGLQVGLLLGQLAKPAITATAAMLILGFVLIEIHQVVMARRRAEA